MAVDPLPTAPHLRLVDENGEVHSDCPGCAQRDERIARLEESVAGLAEELGMKRAQISKLKHQAHEDRKLVGGAEAVKRVYAMHRALNQHRLPEEIPADKLKMGLDRLREYGEERMRTCVIGATTRPKQQWRTWENMFRNTRNFDMYEEFGLEELERRRREMPLGVEMAGLLRFAGLYDAERSSDTLVYAKCPACDEPGFRLDVRSGAHQCVDAECEVLAIDEAFTRLRVTWGERL